MKRTNTASWDEKNKRWRIAVQKDGVRKNFYSSTPGRNGQREANRKADDWLEAGINTRMRCEVALNEYLENVKSRTSAGNYRNEEQRVRLYIKPVIGNMFVEYLNNGVLQEVIDKQTKRLSKKSLKSLRATLTAFVKYCRKKNLTNYIPEDISIAKSAKAKLHNILQPEDLAKLFTVDTVKYKNKLIKDPYINAYRFQVLTGLRPGELIGLKWKDIKNDYVFLQRSINNLNETTTGKNENAIRSFKLTEDAKAILQSQERTSEYIFSIKDQETYRNYFKRFCKSNDITVIPPYDLRHTFVSIAKQLPEGMVKSVVGHSKNMDTFGIYGHVVSGDADITAAKLQDIFSQIIVSET